MTGRIFLVGDNVDTDQLAPGRYMQGGIAEIAAHCLESTRPDFAQSVGPGDILIAGRNFGAGSSREQAAEALKYLGVSGVLAQSFAGIFYRNAINLGLPALVLSDASSISDGDTGHIDLESSQLDLPEKGITIGLEPMPEILRKLLNDGGLVAQLKNRFAKAKTKESRS